MVERVLLSRLDIESPMVLVCVCSSDQHLKERFSVSAKAFITPLSLQFSPLIAIEGQSVCFCGKGDGRPSGK